MNKVFIQNNHLKIGINSKGAELANIQSATNKKEYLWTADPQFWGRHSCVLFPYIGKVWKDQFRIGDQVFAGKQHGIARNLPFENILLEDDKAIFQLQYDEATLKAYPYKFRLLMKYFLEKNKIRIIYEVENLDDQSIYFSLGAHPGFNLPLEKNEKRSDYSLVFEKDEWAESLNLKDGHLEGSSRDIFGGKNVIPISDDLFDQDALIFKNLESNQVHLVNQDGVKIWTFSFEGFPYLGIWSKDESSPFICIEPWLGVADKVSADWDFREKDGVIELKKGNNFKCEHSVIIHT